MKWLCFTLFSSAVLAQDITFTNRVVTFTNLQGTVYEGVTLVKGGPDAIIWRDGATGGKIYYTNLSPSLLRWWGIPTSADDGSRSAAGSTNKLERTPEQSLLAGFPHLLWPRKKLEFMFIQQEKATSALLAGASSDDVAFMVAKEMVKVFDKGEDRKVFTEGWKMTGRLESQSAAFTKVNYTLSGITGEIEMLYDGDRLISFSFYTDGNDAAYARLYQLLVRACSSPGRRTLDDKENGKVEWTIAGNANSYEVQMSQRRFKSELERGVTIFVKGRKAGG